MTAPARWWEIGEQSLEAEQEWFAAAELEFTLDQQTLDEAQVVVFRGELRYGEQRCAATLVYPAAYAAGDQPAVFAPDLPVTRHKRSDGLLCLDHRTLFDTPPMMGAEAVQRAEELWRLSVEDPDALKDQEADAPEPHAEDYELEPGSAVFMFDIDVTGHDEGIFRLGATAVRPFRAAVSELSATRPAPVDLAVDVANDRNAGRTVIDGLWARCASRPPDREPAAVLAWANEKHRDLVGRATLSAGIKRSQTGLAYPALLGFVFPDEGPGRGEWHDAWLLLMIEADQTTRLARVVAVEREDQWIRQPQLKVLSASSVGVVGVGALGSQIAALLARAGVGDFLIVDPDIVTPGNLVRHQLDYSDVGYGKAESMQKALARINPYIEVTGATSRYGSARGAEGFKESQAMEDEITQRLGSCDLIINATADGTTELFVAGIADHARKPAVHVAVSSSAWGCRILAQRPGVSGCLECMALYQEDPKDRRVPEWSDDPAHPEVLERGCAQATFQGAGFELAAAAAAATRTAVQLLLNGEGYPALSYDIATIDFRDATVAEPKATYSQLPRHPECTTCHE